VPPLRLVRLANSGQPEQSLSGAIEHEILNSRDLSKEGQLHRRLAYVMRTASKAMAEFRAEYMVWYRTTFILLYEPTLRPGLKSDSEHSPFIYRVALPPKKFTTVFISRNSRRVKKHFGSTR
jgi:hypothetical protein